MPSSEHGEWSSSSSSRMNSRTKTQAPSSMSPFHFFSDSPHRSRVGDSFKSKGKEKEVFHDDAFRYDQDSPFPTTSFPAHGSSTRTTSFRKPRNSLISFVRSKSPTPKPQASPPLVLSEVIEISRPYSSYVEEEEERERLRDAAAQSIGLVEYAASDHYLDHSQDELDAEAEEQAPATTDLPPPIPSLLSSHVHVPSTASLSPLTPFPATPATLTKQITLSGTFPKFFPPSSLLVYALAKQWKSRFIILTTALKDLSQNETVTHLHLFKSNLSSSPELHRLPITQDTSIYVTEQSGPSRKRDGKGGGVRASSSKPSGTVVAIEQDSFVWHFEMQDPCERQQWIGAIKAVVLGQRSARAGIPAAPYTLSGHEPRGDIDVMLSMRTQQASLSSSISPGPSGSPVSSPRSSESSRSLPRLATSPPPISAALLSANAPSPVPPSQPPIRTSTSLEGLRSHSRSPTLTPPIIPSSTPTKLELLTRKSSKKSQTSGRRMSIASSFAPGSGTSSPVHSIQSHSKRLGNLSAVMLNNNSTHTSEPTQSARSSTSTTKTIKGMFTPRSRSPSLSEGEGDHAEESFGTVGHSLMSIGIDAPMGMGIVRNGSPMGRTESPAPSLVSSAHDGSSVVMSSGSIHNGSVYNGATPSTYNGNGSINGIPASELKIVKEDERCSPSPSSSPLPHISLFPHQSPHSLLPPPRKKHAAAHMPAGTIVQLLDKGNDSSEDLTPTAASMTVPVPDPARLSMLTTSTTTTSSGMERSGSTSSTPPRRWSRTLPKRLTPPSGPLPLTPPQLPQESEQSIKSSPSSPVSPSVVVWKRTSTSSSVSNASASSSPVYPYTMPRTNVAGTGGKRRSMPPPRPAPNFAPPPPPESQQQLQKTRFRTSIARRALRLSLTAPRPPPSGVLPPRPDEPPPIHRRSSSDDSADQPPHPSPPPRPDSAASSRSMSIRQRLRMLSAPSPSTLPQDTTTESPVTIHTELCAGVTNDNGGRSTTHSRSPTPLPGTPITTMQNHPSFLQLAAPVPTIPPRNPLRVERLATAPEITSLSPPPRRGSKMLAVQHLPEKVESDLPDFSDIRAEAGSVVSLGFVSI